MPTEQNFKDRTAVRISLIYVLIGCIWILLSDRVVLWVDGDTERVTLFQTYKGWFFVFSTGFLLYLLIDRSIEEVKRREFKHHEVGERYSELVENAHDIIYELDAVGKFISINHAGEKTLGYTQKEISEKSLEDIVTPDYQKYLHRLLGKTSADKRSVYEIEVFRKDGGKVRLEIGNRPIYRDGELIGIQGIARDLTSRRAVEVKLKESEARYRELIETTNEGFLVTDENGIITFANKRMADMLDYDLEEMIDNYVFDFMVDEDKENALKKLERRRAGIRETFDFRLKTCEGKDLWTIISSRPLFEDDKYVGAIAMVTDITERRQAEELLRKEQKINNATIASLPGIFYFYDETGKFLRWNENFELVSGYTHEEIENLHPLDFFDGEERELLQEKIEEVFEAGEAAVEADFVSKDNSRKSYFFTGKRLILDGKKYLIGMGIDINDSKSLMSIDLDRRKDWSDPPNSAA